MAYMKKASGKSMKMSAKAAPSKGKTMKGDSKMAGKDMSFMEKMQMAKAKKKK